MMRTRLMVAVALVLGTAACDGGTTLSGADADADAEPWRPPVDVVEGGWRDSSEPWDPPVPWDCRYARYQPLGIWSEPTGIFTTYGWEEFRVNTGTGGAELLGTYVSLFHNDGAGWTESWRRSCAEGGSDPTCIERIAGRVTGGLLGWGSSAVGLTVGSDVMFPWPELSGLGDIFVVNERLAYGLRERRVFLFDGSTWGPLPGAVPAMSFNAIWGSESEIWVVGGTGAVAEWVGDGWRIHDARTVLAFTTVWGTGGRHVWAGTAWGRLFHYDGETWSEVSWPDASEGSSCRATIILSMWGAGDTVFFNTADQIVRWDGTDFEVLGYWPAERTSGECRGGVRIQALWGNAVEEVFAAAVDAGTLRPECGSGASNPAGTPFVLYWDGAAFRWI